MWSAVAGGAFDVGRKPRAHLDAGHRAQGVGLAIHRSCVFVLVLLLLGCGAVAPAAFAQGSSVPPPRGGCPAPRVNPTLRPAVVQGDQRALMILDRSRFSGLATSYLAPSGARPQSTPALWEWQCRYASYRILDADSSTAWCEGAAGEGIGEMVAFPFAHPGQDPPPVEMWAGYGKSDVLFRANARPRQVRVWALGVEAVGGLCGPDPCAPNTSPLGSLDVELRDVNGWQPLSLPEHLWTGQNRGTVIGIEILSVYPGARYMDTCISGVRWEGMPTLRP